MTKASAIMGKMDKLTSTLKNKVLYPIQWAVKRPEVKAGTIGTGVGGVYGTLVASEVNTKHPKDSNKTKHLRLFKGLAIGSGVGAAAGGYAGHKYVQAIQKRNMNQVNKIIKGNKGPTLDDILNYGKDE